MKIAVSSASFSIAIARGTWTQLEWLDACANELEVDGVVFDLRDFPRTDSDYLAQLKKSATDLGLTIAAVASSERLPTPDDLSIAAALGAPIAIGVAPERSDRVDAWAEFVAEAKSCARAAKAAGVVVALANQTGTICEDDASLRRIAYDVDGSWLRYALDVRGSAELAELLPRAVIVRASIGDPTTFATDTDAFASEAIASLARYRGFIVLEGEAEDHASQDYHGAVARFVARRFAYLQRNCETLSRLDRT